ncbi:hypothetical protein [Palleronia caenipelagi]|uniref:Elongation factor P n=1 Tax=Palleronia caenipelagi TaxID=2489174 RepID=A0A547Q5D9_9RHOB|nr:hypothetical protein [Palleronia caenipelagi]TRD21583.1 hypothetical protein FEV53_08875 [Palleronia caenipelagi]
MIRSLAAGALAGLVLVTPAFAFRAQNGKFVEALGPDTFVVKWSGKSSPKDFWCAAGDFANRRMHVSPATRLYRYESGRRNPGEGIVFGLTPRSDTGTGTLRLAGGPGMKVAHARILCEDLRERGR